MTPISNRYGDVLEGVLSSVVGTHLHCSVDVAHLPTVCKVHVHEIQLPLPLLLCSMVEAVAWQVHNIEGALKAVEYDGPGLPSKQRSGCKALLVNHSIQEPALAARGACIGVIS